MTSYSTFSLGGFTALLVCLCIFIGLPADSVAQNPGEWFNQPASGDRTERRHENAAVEVNGKFYLIGGRNTRTVQEYDPITGVVRNMNTKTTNLHHFQAVAHEGKAYIIGAMTGNFPDEDPVPNVMIYDPAQDRMITGATIPANRRRGGCGVVLYRGKFYIVSGTRNGHKAFMEDGTTPAHVPWMDVYNPDNDQWIVLPDAPHSRDHFYAAEKDARIYVAGGRRSGFGTPAGTFGNTEAAVDVYDIRSRTWLTGRDAPDDLPTPRAGAGVAILGNELVVLGGEIENAPGDLALATTEALDLRRGNWRELTDLKTGRHGSQAITYRGDVWIGGGSRTRGGTEIAAGADFFEVLSFNGQPGPITKYDDWTTIANAFNPRSETNTLVYKGEMFTFFGFDEQTTIQPSAAAYDFSTNTFRELSRIPEAADGSKTPTHYGLVLVDDVAWLIGGRLGDHPGPVTKQVRTYNLRTDTWGFGPELPFEAGGGAAVRLGNKIHYVGGFDEVAECDMETHLVYDLDEADLGWQDWTDRSPMPLPRNHFGGVALDGKLYTVGGQHGHDGCQNGQNLPYLHRYDPVTDEWTRLADMLRDDSHMEGGIFTIDGKIYSIGGQSQGALTERYDPLTDRWEILPDCELPEPLLGVNARIFQDKLYVAHGGTPDVRYPSSPMRVKNIARSPTRTLSFYPGALSLTLPSGSSRNLEAILSNWNGDAGASFSVNEESFPSWLGSDVSSGLATQSSTELNLTVDASRLAPGSYSFTITAASEGYSTASLPLTVTVTEGGTPPGDFTTTLEAECASVGANWRTVFDPSAGNGAYVAIEPGLNAFDNPPLDVAANYVRFSVAIPAAAPHYVYALLRAPNKNADSFWVRVDNGPWQLWWRGLRSGKAFRWREVLSNPLPLSAGAHTIDVTYREDGTALDRIHISTLPRVPTGLGPVADNCRAVGDSETYVLEAECATVGANWVIGGAATASGGAFVEPRTGANALLAAPADVEANQLSFAFSVGQTQDYYFFARLNAPTGNDDSFWVRVDGGPWLRWWRSLRTGADFEWRMIDDRSFPLAAGPHRIDFAYREDGTLLDKLVVTASSTRPNGEGPAAENCAGTPARRYASHAADLQPVRTEAHAEPSLQLSPNPASTTLNISLHDFSQSEAKLMIMDALGRPILHRSVNVDAPIALDLSQLKPGPHYLRVLTSSGETIQRKFLVQ